MKLNSCHNEDRFSAYLKWASNEVSKWPRTARNILGTHLSERKQMKLRACDAAVLVLRETDNPRVQQGDYRLLHAIAAKLGWEHDADKTCRRVLRALSTTPGPVLKKGYVRRPKNRYVLAFSLPEDPDVEKYKIGF